LSFLTINLNALIYKVLFYERKIILLG
jgi:hypothetical protein